MSATYPRRYEAHVTWEAGRHGIVSAPPRPALKAGPPSDFGGQDEWWSPEHLLLSAANLCLMTTFLAVAERARLKIEGYTGRAEAALDKTPQGIRFTGFELHVSLWVDRLDLERAESLLFTAKKHCLVANALAAPVELHSSVMATPGVSPRA